MRLELAAATHPAELDTCVGICPIPLEHELELCAQRLKLRDLATLTVGDTFLCCGAERKQQLLQEALMDAEDRQKAEAAAKRTAKRERLSKQKAEALKVQEEKAVAEAAAAGQATDEAAAAKAEEVSLPCMCCSWGISRQKQEVSQYIFIICAFRHISIDESMSQALGSVGAQPPGGPQLHTHTLCKGSHCSHDCRVEGRQLAAALQALRWQRPMEQSMEQVCSHTA